MPPSLPLGQSLQPCARTETLRSGKVRWISHGKNMEKLQKEETKRHILGVGWVNDTPQGQGQQSQADPRLAEPSGDCISTTARRRSSNTLTIPNAAACVRSLISAQGSGDGCNLLPTKNTCARTHRVNQAVHPVNSHIITGGQENQQQ